MNELKIFQNSEFGELGVMMIDGKEYFPAAQCARLLEPVQYLFSHIFSANFAAYCVKNTYHTSVCLRIFSL